MANGHVFAGKASGLTHVEDIYLPHKVSERYVPANYIAFRYAIEWEDATPLDRVIITDDTGRVLAGYYPVGMEKTKV